ncbi:MAG: hypothetical protein LDLANPLL_02889 [Turneriella sp.]|nr:hypothetical protein [Turneriella sp.]
MPNKPTNLSEVSFDTRDADIFRIEDTKTKILTTQNYFFPKLEFLVRESLNLVQEVYDQNPYDVMTIVARPRPRPDTKLNSDFSEVYLGIAGKRIPGRNIHLRNRNGKIKSFHVTGFLVYRIGLTGSIQVVLKNYGFGGVTPYNKKY